LLLSTALLFLASPALADATLGVGLSITGDSEIKTSKYDCERHDPITVQYLNAAPNFLAVVPVEKDGATTAMVFVNVISGSGAKYVAGQYEWWTKGPDATLHDVTEGLDAAPVLTCTEEVDTP
jgi:membrane-bound inhibitor of C-type lysozyme